MTTPPQQPPPIRTEITVALTAPALEVAGAWQNRLNISIGDAISYAILVVNDLAQSGDNTWRNISLLPGLNPRTIFMDARPQDVVVAEKKATFWMRIAAALGGIGAIATIWLVLIWIR